MKAWIKKRKEKKAAQEKNIQYFKDEARREAYKEFEEKIKRLTILSKHQVDEIEKYKSELLSQSRKHDEETRLLINNSDNEKQSIRHELTVEQERKITVITENNKENIEQIETQYKIQMLALDSRLKEIEDNELKRQRGYAITMENIDQFTSEIFKESEWITSVYASLQAALYQNNKVIGNMMDNVKIVDDRRQRILQLRDKLLPAIQASREKQLNG